MDYAIGCCILCMHKPLYQGRFSNGYAAAFACKDAYGVYQPGTWVILFSPKRFCVQKHYRLNRRYQYQDVRSYQVRFFPKRGGGLSAAFSSLWLSLPGFSCRLPTVSTPLRPTRQTFAYLAQKLLDQDFSQEKAAIFDKLGHQPLSVEAVEAWQKPLLEGLLHTEGRAFEEWGHWKWGFAQHPPSLHLEHPLSETGQRWVQKMLQSLPIPQAFDYQTQGSIKAWQVVKTPYQQPFFLHSKRCVIPSFHQRLTFLKTHGLLDDAP